MKEKAKMCIKYLGQPKPLDEVILCDNQSEEEILEAVQKFYIKKSKKITKERSKIYEAQLKVAPKSIKIEKMNNRWGSCSSKKEITYHYLITTLPMELIDYIVVHELCHLHYMNHDRSFWRKVGSILKDYKERMRHLQEGS